MQKSFSLPGLLLLIASLMGCHSETPAPNPNSSMRNADSTRIHGKTQTYYFMDWNDVEKGRLVAIFDPSRLTEEAKQTFEKNRKDFGVVTRMGRHGTAPYHIARGVQITPEKAGKTERFLIADQPWEDDITGGDVILEDGRFRCWYTATAPKLRKGLVYVADGRAMETNGTSTCYAESSDGIHWTKPALGLLSFHGSKSNNIVSHIWIDSPFRDNHGKAEERYKAFTFDELPPEDVPKGAGSFQKYGLYGLVSPDGYAWTRLPKPLVKHFSDSWNIAAWDPLLNKYVGYFRGHQGGRSVTRAETADFNNWPMPETLMCTGPEEPPTLDYYSSGFTTYPGAPGLRVMFPGIFHLNTSLVDARLAISRDGRGWNWVSHDAIIENGKNGEWDAGMVFPHPNLLRLPDGRIALPYSGYSDGHDTSFSSQYKDWPKRQTGMAWATWAEGRLAGIEAARTGEFYAANKASDLSELQINARTARGGRIEVELAEGDDVLPGYSFADCAPFSGDQIWTPLHWKGKEKFSDLKGKRFQIHFRLTKAKVFGYRTIAAAR